MWCDNHYPRCGDIDEYINHAILEFTLPLEAWDLSSRHLAHWFFQNRVFLPIWITSAGGNEIEDHDFDRNSDP